MEEAVQTTPSMDAWDNLFPTRNANLCRQDMGYSCLQIKRQDSTETSSFIMKKGIWVLTLATPQEKSEDTYPKVLY